MDHGSGHHEDGPVSSVEGEARALVGVITDLFGGPAGAPTKVDPPAGVAGAVGSQGSGTPGAAEHVCAAPQVCGQCPICVGAGVFRDAAPVVIEGLAQIFDATASMLRGVGAAVAAQSPPGCAPAAADHATRTEPQRTTEPPTDTAPDPTSQRSAS